MEHSPPVAPYQVTPLCVHLKIILVPCLLAHGKFGTAKIPHGNTPLQRVLFLAITLYLATQAEHQETATIVPTAVLGLLQPVLRNVRLKMALVPCLLARGKFGMDLAVVGKLHQQPV